MTPSRKTVLLALALSTAIAAPAFARQSSAVDVRTGLQNLTRTVTAVDPSIRAEVERNHYAVTGDYPIKPKSGMVFFSVSPDPRGDDLTRSILSH